MNCSKVLERVTAFRHGELGRRRAAAVARHLASCERCRCEDARLAELSGRLRQIEPVEPPPFLLARTLARVRSEGRRVRWVLGEALAVRHLVPAAAAAVLIVAMSAGILPRDGGPPAVAAQADPMSCWIEIDPMATSAAGVTLTMADLRGSQSVSSGEFLLAMGALRETRNVAQLTAGRDPVQVTHTIDLERGGRVESEITFADE